VEAINVQVGDTVPVGGVLVQIAPDSAEGAAVTPEVAEISASGDEQGAPAVGGRLRAAPVARRAARQLNIDLESVSGTGPRGRITLDDVRRADKARAPAAAAVGARAPEPDREVERLTPLRRTVAQRMTKSQSIPQFHLTREIDASSLLAHAANVNDLLIQAVAEVVVRHRSLSASYVEDGPALRYSEGVNVGLAVATDRGLVVPVVRDAHRAGLSDTATQRTWLVAAARAGQLSLDQMSGGTITVSNLGATGVDSFAAMVNPGEAAIVAVGRVVDRLVARDRGIAVQPTLTLTMTFDHRVVDGASGAAALTELAGLLEGAMTWRT
jgi:pyruvate dehydrogenase E2 component (dihydrolipoamide acetyltransferase)